jgi:DmsE family decaheme c-type cytochrome
MRLFTVVKKGNAAVSIGAAVALWLVVMVVVTAPAQARGQAPPAAAPASAAPAVQQPAGDTVGDETCLTCHEKQKRGYSDGPHGLLGNPRSPAAKGGCESCHGPGKAHVDGGGDKSKIRNPKGLSSQEVTDACTQCHNRTGHLEWDGGKHAARNVSCLTCHSVHEFKSPEKQLTKETQTETCVQCHRTQVNKLHRSAHMPVREGKMECSSCHNPHGSQNVKMLRTGNSITEACSSCHAEKRGPFLWEHAVGRESCVTCHDPHGSSNERMLVSKVPMLCQRCHVHSRHPATIYDNTQLTVSKSNRVVGRSCLNCHQMVHGSNHPTSGKVFTR